MPLTAAHAAVAPSAMPIRSAKVAPILVRLILSPARHAARALSPGERRHVVGEPRQRQLVDVAARRHEAARLLLLDGDRELRRDALADHDEALIPAHRRRAVWAVAVRIDHLAVGDS